MDDLKEELKILQIEDYIWILYIFLSVLALLSNAYEKDYDIHHNPHSYRTFHFINLENQIIIFFVYLYFLYRACIRCKKQKGRVSIKKDILNNTSLLTNILFVIAGFTLILIEISSRQENEEMIVIE